MVFPTAQAQQEAAQRELEKERLALEREIENLRAAHARDQDQHRFAAENDRQGTNTTWGEKFESAKNTHLLETERY